MKTKPENSARQNDLTNRGDQPRAGRWATGPARAIPAIVRAHVVDEAEQKTVQQEVVSAYAQSEQDSYWPSMTLVFHTVSTGDEIGSLRFGTHIVEWFDPLINQVERLEEGFFLGEALSEAEREMIDGYCRAHNLPCITRRQWLEDIFFTIGYRGRGVIVGFNLPRALAAIATRASEIRLQKPKVDKDGKLTMPGYLNKLYAGGWKMVFNEREKKDEPGQFRERGYRPSVWIKPITSIAAMYRWVRFVNWQEHPGIVKWPYRKGADVSAENDTKKDGQELAEEGEGFYPGHLVDVRTLGLALSKDDDEKGTEKRTLRHLCKVFGVEVPQPISTQSEGPLTEPDLDAARNTTAATLSLYYAELNEYRKHALSVTPDQIYSGASLGKAYLRRMGVSAPPPLDTSAVPYSVDQVLGFAMCAYHPGRSEAHIVNVRLPVTYVDYHGMYPAVCILQGLFELMKAQTIQVTDATAETIEFLEKVRPKDSFNPETWRKLNVLCLVEPRSDVLPIRADFRSRKLKGSAITYRAALAMIESAREPIWWPLADCLESKRRTGKPPKISLALALKPQGSRALTPISIHGGALIDPNLEDLFRALVEARDRMSHDDPKHAEALKIVVNAISYGIWAEVDIENGKRVVTAYGNEERPAEIAHGEKPGSFYAPIFAALITAGARHMLGLLEGEIEKLGGVTAFCDTDSLAIVSSEKGGTVQYVDHRGKTQELPVLKWTLVDEALHKFDVLNPYRSGEPLIKLERENFEDKDPSKPRVNLHTKVIAAKRYGLFLPTAEPGQLPKIVKASYHTLGIVEPPRDAQGGEIEHWIDQLWAHIAADISFNPPWAAQFVVFQLAISRPEIRRSFREICAANPFDTGNKWMNPYLSRVKPFSVLAVLSKSRKNASRVENVDESDELKDVPVIAPLALDGQDRPRRWVARTSGKPVYLLPPDPTMDLNERRAVRESIERGGWLVTAPMTFAEFMDDYRRHHESKARDVYGDQTDRYTIGPLEYPHVRITELLFTGKETVLQEELERGLISEAEVAADRVMIPQGRDPLAELVIEVLHQLPKAEARRLDVSRREIDKINGEDDKAMRKSGTALVRLVERISDYLHEHYPDEIGDSEGEEALRGFTSSRIRIDEHWQAIKPTLSRMSTNDLMKIAGCSRGTAKNIKYGRVEPRIETIKKILAALSNVYNSPRSVNHGKSQ